MLSRLHISSFIGLTILVWLLALWVQGEPVLKWEFIKPFGLVVGVIFFVLTLFNKYMWAWRIFRNWFVKRPDIRGTWKVELRSNWVDANSGKKIKPVIGYIAVRQTLTQLSFKLMTKESLSTLVAHNINYQDPEAVYKLTGVYRNEPDIDLQGRKSEIHHGAFSLDIYGLPVNELRGFYWTDRGTKGGMKVTERKATVLDTFEDAVKFFSTE